MKTLFRTLAVFLALLLAFPAFAAEESAPDVSEYFTARDLSGAWDDAVAITLNGDSAACEDGSVLIDGGKVTITAEGVYLLSGTLTDGSIIVDSEEKVQLVLAGVSVTSADSAALLVENADKVFVTLAEGTENFLANGGAFAGEEGVDGAVFARDDIVFNGSGSLTVSSPAGHGIVGKDDVKIASGAYVIEAASRGIDANDSVRFAGGSFTIVSGKDAIRAKNEEDSEKGYIVIFDGAFSLTAGGGAANAASHSQGRMGFGRQASSASEGSSSSTKGIKATGGVTILGGSVSVDSADDAVHSDADVSILGGSLLLSSGDDGVHANDTLSISGGEIAISRSYEGLEGRCVRISGGVISLTASDDGINAAGGADSSGYGFYDMFASQEGVSIVISGGALYVNASGDGIDSNGDLLVSGGTIVVSGPTNSGNAALDYNGSGVITGGSVIAAGASGMAENFGSGSTQAAALVNLSGQAGEIIVTDESGSVVLSGTVDKAFDCVIVSSPDLAVGETYTVSCGSSQTSVTLSSTIIGSGMGMGGRSGMGGFGGGMGGRQGGFGGQQEGQGGMPGMPGAQEGQEGQSGDQGGPNGGQGDFGGGMPGQGGPGGHRGRG